MSKKTVGLVGLGRMGSAIAATLLAKGYQVIGYDVVPEAAARLTALGGRAVAEPAELPGLAEVILVFVLNGDQVLQAAEGLLPACDRNNALVCLSTIRKAQVEALAERCAEYGVGLVDCPVTGGPPRAADGTLTLIAAGEAALVERLRPILDDLGALAVVGEAPGLGQAVKHCNQLLVSVTHAAALEMLLLARRLGLDVDQVRDIVSSGVAGSAYYDLLTTSLLEKSPAPCTLGLLAKDCAMVADTAASLNLPLLTAAAAQQYFQAGLANGLAEEEGWAMIKVMEGLAGERD